jgi:hypothetical protein
MWHDSRKNHSPYGVHVGRRDTPNTENANGLKFPPGRRCQLPIGGAFKIAQLPATRCPAKSFFTNGTESTSDALTAPP